ncbi:Rieske (2Fe-2S) domain protein [Monoraphidium neglectum]|uniref:Rieske (2Fe-2S) domain protein n=1 Tax=Monoraphidium neglectum TaxID=145388 RepID=A0A0D2JKT8_9CHLO|nr:Rieske (2Fe-2S) domain protein [Monoraphidium neglectum]KIY99872.1 Rieske (2Fe-2S) domain protein [Monoraphidium neglectum]|eukprot:XP_013898892.1 Rieske (2Fe-2S) domain protein [Monoraphidium neglectum]
MQCAYPSRPHAIELLGKKLVLWRDGGGAWRCHQDACPHRLAPLSEGRVEGGQLECSYHGWRFDGAGRCTRIPQSLDAKAEATACASGRSCVTAYPLKEYAGVIWVWGDASPGAAAEAEATPLPVPRGLQQHAEAEGPAEAPAEGSAKGAAEGPAEVSGYRRELPYSWDVLLENVTDPAHLPHSHHRLSPTLTRDKAGPMPFIKQQQPSQGGAADDSSGAAVAAEATARPLYAFEHAPPVGSFAFPSALSPNGVVAYNAPCSVVYEYALPGGACMWTLIYGTPCGPGRSIVMTAGFNNRPPAMWGDLAKTVLTNWKALRPLLMRLYFQAIPSWKGHMISNKLFDMDNVFLHQQDILLEQRGRGSWARDYYMPEQCDSLVVATRKWIDSKAGGGPDYGPAAGPIKPLSKRDLQDRWAQHTQHCVTCLAAMAAVRRRAQVAKAAATVLFAGLCAALGTFGVPRILAGGAPALVAAAAAAGAAVALWVARRAAAALDQFTHVEFTHADNH